MWRERFAVVLLVVLLLLGVLVLITQTKPQGNIEPTPQPTMKSVQPTMQKEIQRKKYSVILETSKGTITLLLDGTKTPVTVSNFVELAKKGFYNKTIFHRVIKGFMIQGGDPKGDGTGGPGYRFNDEPFEGEYTRGTIAMANAGPNTNGSQFFIMHKDYKLPKNYVIFGTVTDGMNVVDAIAETETSPENDRPLQPITITKVTVHEI